MPELPEVETVCRGLDRAMTGKTIVSVDQNRPDLRFPFPENFSTRLTGHKVSRIERRAKYVLVELEGDLILLMHLGMSGRFEILTGPGSREAGTFHRPVKYSKADAKVYGKHAHVVFHLEDGTKIVYTDPRRFGFMDLMSFDQRENHPQLKILGIEPLGNEMHGEYIQNNFRHRKTSLKATLLNQKIIAGIGNIYACESLYHARLSPLRQAASLASSDGNGRESAENLALAIKSVLTAAIEAGGSSLRDFANVEGELGYFQHSFQVYDQSGEACKRMGCDGVIERIVQNNRSTFFCPMCQK
jgi:formamidopyrimidine-DNA glycosylase